MGNTARKIEGSADEAPPTFHRYRAPLRWMNTGQKIVWVTAFGSAILLMIIGYFRDCPEATAPLAAFLVGLGVPCVLIQQLVLKHTANLKIQVMNEGIRLHQISKVVDLPFKDITTIKFRHVELGGYVRLRGRDRKTFDLTPMIERSELILKAIHEARPELVDEGILNRYWFVAVRTDHGFERTREWRKKWKSVLFKLICFPVIQAVLFSGLASRQLPTIKLLLIFITCTYFAGALFSVGPALVIGRRLKKSMQKNPRSRDRDIEFESKIFANADKWFYISTSLLIVAGAVLKRLS